MTSEAAALGPAGDRKTRPILVKASGPWPFITERHYLHEGGHAIWQSRPHRKGLRHPFFAAGLGLWAPGLLNWWIATGFAIGSLMFLLGSVGSLYPDLAAMLGLTGRQVDLVYFAGSVFFTAAAYLQLFQAANVGEFPPVPGRLATSVFVGWKPRDIGWLGCFLQFVGTLLFNVNTYMAIGNAGDWLRQDLTIWQPDVLGSLLFLASGYLAFIETCHRHFAWRPGDLSWWVVSVNLLGCVAFIVSAGFAFVGPGGQTALAVTISVAFTLVGAIGFLTGSLLMLLEGAAAQE